MDMSFLETQPYFFKNHLHNENINIVEEDKFFNLHVEEDTSLKISSNHD